MSVTQDQLEMLVGWLSLSATHYPRNNDPRLIEAIDAIVTEVVELRAELADSQAEVKRLREGLLEISLVGTSRHVHDLYQRGRNLDWCIDKANSLLATASTDAGETPQIIEVSTNYCPICKGSGYLPPADEVVCPTCEGTGWPKTKKEKL